MGIIIHHEIRIPSLNNQYFMVQVSDGFFLWLRKFIYWIFLNYRSGYINGKLPILFPYHSHIFTDSYGSGMGIVWVPLTIRGSHYWGSLKIQLNISHFGVLTLSSRRVSLRG